MKPVVTWVVVANAREAKVFENRGPGKGLSTAPLKVWNADVPNEPDDKPGVGHSIAGPGVSAVQETDLKRENETRFAKQVAQDLSLSQGKKEFDRLILVCGPHMLGALRAQLDDPVRRLIVGSIAKDLAAHTVEDIEGHLGDIIAL